MKDKALEALNELKEDSSKIRNDYTLEDWRNKATNIIIRIFGKGSTPEKQIESLTYWESFNSSKNNISERQQQALQLIDGLIKEIERFGLPEIAKKEEKGLHINITQSQNQETKVSLSVFIASIQEELTGKQLKELQEIIGDETIKQEVKKSRIIDKLKQFGTDVATNVLANILTNPSLFG